jgi:hypothetical protein
MTLPKEWQQEADRVSELQEGTYTIQHKRTYTHGFIDGATAYKQAVEKQIALERTCYQDPLADLVLDELLKSLQTLKPTSND